MSKPWIHSKSSARRFGGVPEDYLAIHEFMDSSKGAIADNRHRCLTHTSWFLSVVLQRVKFHNSIEAPDGSFPTIKNSEDKVVSIRDIGEQHILEDFRMKFIPTPQDYIANMEMQPWMNNAIHGYPESAVKIVPKELEVTVTV